MAEFETYPEDFGNGEFSVQKPDLDPITGTFPTISEGREDTDAQNKTDFPTAYPLADQFPGPFSEDPEAY